MTITHVAELVEAEPHTFGAFFSISHKKTTHEWVAKTNNHDNQRNSYRMAQIYITFSNYLNITIGKSQYLSFA